MIKLMSVNLKNKMEDSVSVNGCGEILYYATIFFNEFLSSNVHGQLHT